jgi:hypothetical protein
MPDDVTTSDAAVRWYIKEWFRDLIQELRVRVVTPISQLENGGKSTRDSQLDAKAKDGIRMLKRYVDNFDPEFIKKYQEGDKDAMNHLGQVVRQSFDEVKSGSSARLKEVEELKRKAELNKRKAEKLLGNIQSVMQDMESRLKSLQTPLGPVPVSLTEFIVLFPFVIVILLVMLTAALHKSGHLYLSFWHEFSKENTTKDRGEFQQFADCWYLPPHKSIAQRLLLIALLVVISGIFIRAGLLVISNIDVELYPFLFPFEDSLTNMILAEESPIEFPSAKVPFARVVYTWTSIVGAFIIICCFWHIFITLRRIKKQVIE